LRTRFLIGRLVPHGHTLADKLGECASRREARRTWPARAVAALDVTARNGNGAPAAFPGSRNVTRGHMPTHPADDDRSQPISQRFPPAWTLRPNPRSRSTRRSVFRTARITPPAPFTTILVAPGGQWLPPRFQAADAYRSHINRLVGFGVNRIALERRHSPRSLRAKFST